METKILHIIGTLDAKLGGTYSAIYSIMNIENKMGYANEIISTKSARQQYDNDFFNEKIHLFEKTFPKRFRFSKIGIEWLKANIKKYDLVVIHEVWGGLAIRAAILAHKMGIKYVIWPHGSLDPFDLVKKKYLKQLIGKKLIGRVIADAEGICCTSTLEKQLLETYNKTPKNIQTLPLPIDYKEEGSAESFRKKFSISKQSFVFLFLSRIDYKKGLDIFLIALSNYLKNNPDTNIKFVIAGSGIKNYQDLINKIIFENSLSNNIVHAGFLSGKDKADALAGADCFVLTSMNENYGISTIEALQAGLPVLISNNTYIWEKIVPGGGWVCDYSVASVENTLEQILNCKEPFDKEPKKMGEQFSTKALMKYYKSFYNSLELKSNTL